MSASVSLMVFVDKDLDELLGGQREGVSNLFWSGHVLDVLDVF